MSTVCQREGCTNINELQAASGDSILYPRKEKKYFPYEYSKSEEGKQMGSTLFTTPGAFSIHIMISNGKARMAVNARNLITTNCLLW
jgi:hypothetical protein